jgi:hypothetical protein
MSNNKRNLPKAVRIALAHDHMVPHEIAEVMADEMQHEYAGAIRRLNDLSERIDDALAFFSLSSDGIRAEAPWHNQPGLCEGY